MGPEDILRTAQQGLWLALLVAAPAVLTALVVGVVVSLGQALTQIQDATLGFVPKLVAGCAVLAITGAWALTQLVAFTGEVFASFAAVVR